MNNTENGLIVNGLSKSIGGSQILLPLCFHVPHGSVFGIFGPNGSGKSTLIGLLSGLIAPSAGEVWVDGANLLTDIEAFRHTIGVLPSDLALVPQLTAEEHLELSARIHKLPRSIAKERTHSLLRFFDLEKDSHKFPGELSLGNSKKLALAMILTTQPSVLLLDEPFEGLDPGSARNLSCLVRKLAQSGTTVLLASHILDIADRTIDSFIILRNGRIVFDASKDLSEGPNPLEYAYFTYVSPSRDESLEWIG